MNTKIKHIIFLLLGIVLISEYSCRKDTYDTSSINTLGYDYYPLVKGKFIIYNIEEISIDVLAGKYDTLRYQLKELLADTIFSKDSIETSYKIERFVRMDSTKAWEIKNVWQVKQTKTCLIRGEENLPLVKLVYPMVTHQTWNINRYDTLPEKLNTLKSFDKTDTINGKIFEKVAQTMIVEDTSSIFQKKYEIEKYVRGIGLAYKQLVDVESQSKDINKPVDINKPIMQRITMGTIITWNIYSHN